MLIGILDDSSGQVEIGKEIFNGTMLDPYFKDSTRYMTSFHSLDGIRGQAYIINIKDPEYAKLRNEFGNSLSFISFEEAHHSEQK